MVEATEFCDGYDLAISHNLTLNRALLTECQMWTRSMVVAEIRSQRFLQVPSVQNDEVIQTLRLYRSDQSPGIGVLPGTLRCGKHLFDTQRLQSPRYLIAINTIAIPDQISRCFAVSESLDKLLCNPVWSENSLGRLGKVEEFVGLVLYLSSRTCEYMTGQVIHLNGGRLMSS